MGRLNLWVWVLGLMVLSVLMGIVGAVMAAEPGAATPAIPVSSAPDTSTLGYVKDASEDFRSLGASGHAVLFERPDGASFIESVQIFAARYGMPEPPQENFHLYVLNEKQQVLADVEFPYSFVERGNLRWYVLNTPSVEVPKQFYVALAFNPHQTKGIYLGLDKSVAQSHSFTGLPGAGYSKVTETFDWMVRVTLVAAPSGKFGVRRLADWKPPQAAADPFAGCIEIAFSSDVTENKQSYGGSGPAIKFTISDGTPSTVPSKLYVIKGFRFYGSRYGSGYEPNTTMIKAALQDAQGKIIWQESFPYALLSYKAKWVDLVPSQPIPLAGQAVAPLTFSLNPEAHQTKGVYFHYLKNPPKSHSLAGTVEMGFKEVADREWLIRVYLAAVN
ncbi:MAG: hypothetical protein NT106_02985 [Candidatus Sumerlaeota bacterium]|nr:hypothetical protein [Candidatus Sumerlaeota bacterium]